MNLSVMSTGTCAPADACGVRFQRWPRHISFSVSQHEVQVPTQQPKNLRWDDRRYEGKERVASICFGLLRFAVVCKFGFVYVPSCRHSARWLMRCSLAQQGNTVYGSFMKLSGAHVFSGFCYQIIKVESRHWSLMCCSRIACSASHAHPCYRV